MSKLIEKEIGRKLPDDAMLIASVDPVTGLCQVNSQTYGWGFGYRVSKHPELHAEVMDNDTATRRANDAEATARSKPSASAVPQGEADCGCTQMDNQAQAETA